MEIVLISPVSPFDPSNGHRIAVLSDVHALLDNGADLGVIAFTYDGEVDSIPDLCPTVRVAAGSGGFASRFLRGVFKGLPPSAERLYGRAAREAVCGAIRKWRPNVVIIDDTSVAGYIPDIRSIVPNATVVLRTHNVMHDIRTEQLSRAKGPSRPAIAFDCARYVEFERNAVLSSDCHWAITNADAQRIHKLYGRTGQCLTVSVPFDRYFALRSDQGERNGFVHVGSLDFRRRTDLCHFLDERWPRVLTVDESAVLTLAGELKGKPVHARNVNYAGRVENDAEMYRHSRFALNFQSSPGGVKIKTLTSLAAGRTLLSTREGVEGIAIKSGREFFDIDQFLERDDLGELLSDVRSTQSIADAGRHYVSVHHSRSVVAGQILNLLDRVPACL